MASLDTERNRFNGGFSYDDHARPLLSSRPSSMQGAAPQRGLPRSALRRVLGAIHARLGEKITLKDIADAACMSRYHFARLFRRSTGYSPMEYLLYTRLEKAKALLRAGTLPISDIAVATGFADQSHLTRHFRRAVGLTPLRYARHNADALSSVACSLFD